MKKLLALAVCMVFCAGVSFAARGDGGSSYSSQSSGSKKASYSKSSKKSSKDSTGKIGVGYQKYTLNTIQNTDLDAVVLRYYTSAENAVEVSLGFNTGDAVTAYILGGKFLGVVKTIGNLDIYWNAGMDIGSVDAKMARWKTSILRFFGGFGAEYHILPQLSVLTEVGVQYTSAKPDGGDSINNFGTYADWLPQAGIRYYF